MTLLQVMAEGDRDDVLLRTTDLAVIAAELAPFNITLEQWDTVELSDDAGQDEVLEAYKADVEKVSKEGEYRLVDVVRMKPSDDPEWPAKAKGAREKFLNEHTHDEDEVRFFVEGSGAFYLRKAGRVFKVVCTKDDLISVPAGTTHWFDMGPAPRFTAIRLFENSDGWIARFTGDTIARRFPLYAG